MAQISTKGLITHETNYGESHRILTIITEDFGKISVMANRIRAKNSRILAGAQLFCYSDLELYSGRSMYTLNEATAIQSFRNITSSLDLLAYATYFADIANTLLPENVKEPEQLRLLLNSFFILSSGKITAEKIKPVYELRSMCLAGYQPSLIKCFACANESDEDEYFDLTQGVLLCHKCKTAYSLPLPKVIKFAMLHIMLTEAKQAFSFEMSKVALDSLNEFCENYVQHQLSKSFKTLEYLKKVINL